MKITYFIRAKQSSISIGKHFRPLIAKIGETEEVETFYLPCANYDIKGIIRNLWFVYRHRNKKGINHVTGDCYFIIFALLGCKTVLTVHDLGFYTMHLHEMNWIKRKFLYYLQIYYPIKYATKVIAITEKTRKEIEDLVPFSREIVIAKHISVDAFPFTPKYLNTANVVVMQCGTSPNKNLETTIKAMKGLPYELRVVRKMSEEQKQLATNLGIMYSNVYNISDEQQTKEYQNADIVCFPSLYEGFGAIIIEAQATGRPVITTDREPMRSVSGGAAYLMKDPQDVAEMRSAIMKIIKDDDYREELIARGRENASKYTLKNCAKEHLELYRSI